MVGTGMLFTYSPPSKVSSNGSPPLLRERVVAGRRVDPHVARRAEQLALQRRLLDAALRDAGARVAPLVARRAWTLGDGLFASEARRVDARVERILVEGRAARAPVGHLVEGNQIVVDGELVGEARVGAAGIAAIPDVGAGDAREQRLRGLVARDGRVDERDVLRRRVAVPDEGEEDVGRVAGDGLDERRADALDRLPEAAPPRRARPSARTSAAR